MAEMDSEIHDLLVKHPQWESFKTKYIQHQGSREEAKLGTAPFDV